MREAQQRILRGKVRGGCAIHRQIHVLGATCKQTGFVQTTKCSATTPIYGLIFTMYWGLLRNIHRLSAATHTHTHDMAFGVVAGDLACLTGCSNQHPLPLTLRTRKTEYFLLMINDRLALTAHRLELQHHTDSQSRLVRNHTEATTGHLKH
jgi:hypothetical protein